MYVFMYVCIYAYMKLLSNTHIHTHTHTYVCTENKFIIKWLSDPTLRIYDKYAFVPPPLKCDTTYSKTWRDLDVFKYKVPYER